MKSRDRNPEITVVVPTRDRAGLLVEFFRGLAAQTLDKSLWELLLVDDGSRDDSVSRARVLLDEAGIRGRVIAGGHGGRSAARNRGIAAARGGQLVILADDIVATPGLLEAHRRFHHRWPEDVSVGRVTWWPGMEISPFMEFLEEGSMLSLNGLEDRQQLDYRRSYSSNISLPLAAARREPFDEGFSGYGFEDIEWGYRLQQLGLKFRFNRGALGYHRHRVEEDEYLAKMDQAGYALAMMYSRHPEIPRRELERATSRWRFNLAVKSRWRRALLRNPLLGRWGLKVDRRRCWKSVLDLVYIRGLMRGKRELLK